MRIVLAGIVVTLVLVLGARPADACGVWHMSDKEKKLEISWLVNAGTIKTAKQKRVGALYLDIESKDGLKVVRSRKVVFDVKNGKLRKYGKPVATFGDGSSIAFGKRTYTIELGDEKQLHGMAAWPLTVKRGDDVIIESSDASALCAFMHHKMQGKQLTTAEQQDEIRRRVAFYLAWREVGL